MHFVDAKAILTGKNGFQGMNIYRGCIVVRYYNGIPFESGCYWIDRQG